MCVLADDCRQKTPLHRTRNEQQQRQSSSASVGCAWIPPAALRLKRQSIDSQRPPTNSTQASTCQIDRTVPILMRARTHVPIYSHMHMYFSHLYNLDLIVRTTRARHKHKRRHTSNTRALAYRKYAPKIHGRRRAPRRVRSERSATSATDETHGHRDAVRKVRTSGAVSFSGSANALFCSLCVIPNGVGGQKTDHR